MLTSIAFSMLLAFGPKPLLPEGPFSFCSSALMVAQAVNCKALGPACYETVAALYNPPAEPDPRMVEAADCDLASDPDCIGEKIECFSAPGPAFCMLFVGDSVESCTGDALVAGVTDAAVAELTCERIFLVFGP